MLLLFKRRKRLFWGYISRKRLNGLKWNFSHREVHAKVYKFHVDYVHVTSLRHDVLTSWSFSFLVFSYYYSSCFSNMFRTFVRETVSEKLHVRLQWNFVYVYGTVFRIRDRKFNDLDKWPWPIWGQGRLLTLWPISRWIINFFSFWLFYIVGLTDGYKKVCYSIYVTVTLSCVTAALTYVTCYISSIFVTNRARNSMLVSSGRFLRPPNPMVLAFPSDECKGL